MEDENVPIVPGFQYDLFVSYAHQNDKPWGWVSEFIRTLEQELAGKSRDFKLWWDPHLRSGEDFNLAIAEAISQSAVFLCVLSPAYGDSGYCKREAEEFRKQRHPAFGLTVGTLSRMQGIVIAGDFQKARWPPELRTTSPWPFYSDSVSLFSKPSAFNSDSPWVQGLWKVRDSVWAVLDEMQKQRREGTAVERSYEITCAGADTGADTSPTVYLAEVTDDLYRRRENLHTSLTQNSEVQVSLWQDTAPPASSGLNLLSVHLFGPYPGRPAPGADVALPILQLEAAIKANPARRPIVWLARDLQISKAETASHKQFLTSLLDRRGIELLRTDFEDLKDEIPGRIQQGIKAGLNASRRTLRDSIVHIWYQAGDPAPLGALKQYLQQKNCGISVFEYSSGQTEKLQSRLAICDGLVVPYSCSTRTWAEDVMTEVFRMRRREERPLAFAAVEMPPPSSEQFNFEHPRVVSVHATQEGSLQEIDAFLTMLGQQDV